MKANAQQKYLQKVGLDVETSAVCIAVLLFGQTIMNYQPCGKPRTLAAMVPYSLKFIASKRLA
jgi:hypothetical protein